MLAGLVFARGAGRDDPARQAELPRHKQRGAYVDRHGIIETSGGKGRMSMCGIGGLQGEVATKSAYDPAAAHPHRIFSASAMVAVVALGGSLPRQAVRGGHHGGVAWRSCQKFRPRSG